MLRLVTAELGRRIVWDRLPMADGTAVGTKWWSGQKVSPGGSWRPCIDKMIGIRGTTRTMGEVTLWIMFFVDPGIIVFWDRLGFCVNILSKVPAHQLGLHILITTPLK